jgi:hypothetical protein
MFSGRARVRAPSTGSDGIPQGRWLAAGASDARIYVYDTAAGVLRDTLAGHADVVTAVA